MIEKHERREEENKVVNRVCIALFVLAMLLVGLPWAIMEPIR